MDFDQLNDRFRSLNLRQMVWLFPIAYVMHVLEELPQFTNWARRYAAPNFTTRDYLTVHSIGIAVALLASLVVSFFPNRGVIFLFFTFVFTPAVCFNILFHAGATAVFGVYCPGLITALVLYPPLFSAVSRRAISERLLTNQAALISFVVAGLFHAADVSRNVFQLW
jgi:hypothetical protein